MAFTMCRTHWNMLMDELEDRGLGKYLVNSKRELETVEFREPGFQGLGMIVSNFVAYLAQKLEWDQGQIHELNTEGGEYDPVFKLNVLCVICWMDENQPCDCGGGHSYERWIEYAGRDVEEMWREMTSPVPRRN